MPDSTLNLCLGKPLVWLRPRAVCFSHYTTVPVSVFVSCQERGQYDAAARHGVAPLKQGLLCALLAAWDTGTLIRWKRLRSPVLKARARSLHKVLEALRDVWIEDPLTIPNSQIYPQAALARGVHGDLVPEGMPPFPATQLGLPKELGKPAAEIGPPQAEVLDAVEDPIEDKTAAVPLSLPRFQHPDIQPVGRSAPSQDNGNSLQHEQRLRTK